MAITRVMASETLRTIMGVIFWGGREPSPPPWIRLCRARSLVWHLVVLFHWCVAFLYIVLQQTATCDSPVGKLLQKAYVSTYRSNTLWLITDLWHGLRRACNGRRRFDSCDSTTTKSLSSRWAVFHSNGLRTDGNFDQRRKWCPEFITAVGVMFLPSWFVRSSVSPRDYSESCG